MAFHPNYCEFHLLYDNFIPILQKYVSIYQGLVNIGVGFILYLVQHSAYSNSSVIIMLIINK